MNNANETEKALSVNEVAARLRKHPEVIRRWIRDGKLKAYRSGSLGNFSIYPADIEKALEYSPSK